ncbi:hypothetical protein PS870_02410 [Pseudomonas fluorescens]|uniref:Uncharacterized protein n=1 Tax=Pseudomonas fluorescens TaxID=294 RepID=A0A5E7JY50_PSEFL|nr:hypothetical protein PS870_02410 [Pseudomonas fluorescens]
MEDELEQLAVDYLSSVLGLNERREAPEQRYSRS